MKLVTSCVVTVMSRVGACFWSVCLWSSVVHGQQPINPQNAGSPDAVFRFRALGPVNNVRAKLTDERQWTMRDGSILAGRALLSHRTNFIEIERVNHIGPGPRKVIAPQAAFSDADLATLKLAMPVIKVEARMLGLLATFDVTPQWSKAKPKLPKRYTRAVAVEENHVIFRAGDELYLVPKAAFTPASYAEVLEQFQTHGAGRFIKLSGALDQVAGQLLLELESDFVFQAVDAARAPGSVLKAGQRFRVPKHWMTSEQIEDLQGLIKRFPMQEKLEAPSVKQRLQMTSLRLLKGTFTYCDIETQGHNSSLLAYDAVDKTHRESMHQLTSRDYVAIVRELEMDAKPNNPKDMNEYNSILIVAAASSQMEWWLCGPRHTVFSGRFIGKLGDLYFFKQPNAGPFFYVLPADLSELDRKIIESIQRDQLATWTQGLDLVELFSRRMLTNNGHAHVVWLGTETITADSAVQGLVPIVGRSANVELPWPELDLTNIREVERSRTFKRAHQAALAARDLSRLIPAIATDFNQPASAASSASKVAQSSNTGGNIAPNASSVKQVEALPKREHWKLLNSYGDFVGELVGEHEGDWVFMERVKGNNKYFLADPDIIAPESREKGEAALKKMKKQSWDERLSVAGNWQIFRVWHDPTGKVRTPSRPVVVLSISQSLMQFESLDGSQHSDRSPADEAGLQAAIEYYRPAFEQAELVKNRAEENLMVWKFRDCEPTLRAALVGESKADFLVKDAKNVEYLINKACLDPDFDADVQTARRFTPGLRVLSDAETQSMLRVWCTRTKLIGPAKPINLTFDDQLEIVKTDGQHEFLKLRDLTLREQLSFEKQWRIAHGQLNANPKLATATNADELDAELKAAIPSSEVIQSVPELRADIREAIDANLSKWQNPTWSSTPIRLDPNAKLLAINEDARFGVVDEGNKGWTVVELASGKRKTIRGPSKVELVGKNQQLCWMFRDPRVFWIEDATIFVSGSNVNDAKPAISLPAPIAAASQSTDYSSLVLQLSDFSSYRFDLASYELRQIAPAQEGRPQSNVVVVPSGGSVTDALQQLQSAQTPTSSQSSIWASSDGTAFTSFAGNMVQFQVPGRDDAEQPRLAFLGTSKPVLRATSNRQVSLVQTDETGLLSMLVASVTSPAPRRLGMPFNPRWFGIVKCTENPDDKNPNADKELIQFVGKPSDAFFAPSGYFFVHQMPLNTDYKKYAYQFVMGEMNEYMRIAANGAAIVHLREGKYVVSRRPAAIPVILPVTFSEIVDRLVEQRDIGQLESLGRYLEQPKFQGVGPYAGWVGLQYVRSVELACFEYQPMIGGDRLERSLLLASHMKRKFPESQVAANVIVDIHRGLAWSARGGGYADAVTEAGIKTFRTEMETARGLVEPLMKAPQPLAASFQSAIDISMATTTSLEGPRQLAVRLLQSPHQNNTQLHHQMALLLLPRWHGAPGTSEAYIQKAAASVPKDNVKAMYAQQVALLMPQLGYETPVTSQLQVDLKTIFEGAKEYYQNRTDGDLLDQVILILAVEQKFEWIRELLKLRAEKRLMPSATAANNALSFRNIEEHCGK